MHIPYHPGEQSIGWTTLDIKKQSFRSLSNALVGERWLEISSCLFGFILPHFDLSKDGRILSDIKRQFASMKESIYTSKQLKHEDVVMIGYDLLLRIERSKQNQYWRHEDLSYYLKETIAGMVNNRKFIIKRWQEEDKRYAEAEQNQAYVQKMLKEEEEQVCQCQVCNIKIDHSSMGILECGHIFHRQCLNKYFQVQIEAYQLDIKCPLQTCNQSLPPSDILNFIDGGLLIKFERFSFKQFVESNPINISWCPTAGCTVVFEFDEALDNYKCPVCEKHYCLICRCQYHTGMTCAEYRVNNSFDVNDQKFIDFVKGAKFKQCPKCNYWVERSYGCSTMSCKCGQNFCYTCGGTGCPHGSCRNSGRKK